MGPQTGKDAATQKTAKQGPGNTLSAGCSVTGNVAFKGPTILSGQIKGDVDCDGLLIVESGGAIEGNVIATTIVVHGAIAGGIEARESIEVGPAGRLTGSAYAPSLRVDGGARVDANLVISATRSVAHINRADAVPDLSNVSPLSPARADANAPASDEAIPEPLAPAVNA